LPIIGTKRALLRYLSGKNAHFVRREEKLSLKPKILMIDDDHALLAGMRSAFDAEYEVLGSSGEEDGLAKFRKEKPPVVTLDLTLSPLNSSDLGGLRLLKRFLSIAPYTRVIIVSGNNNHLNAVRAVQLGAFDYVTKPVHLDELRTIVGRAIHLHRLLVRAFDARQTFTDRNSCAVQGTQFTSTDADPLATSEITSAPLAVATDDFSKLVNLKAAKKAIEIDFVKRALFHNKGVVSRAAKDLGISRVSLYDLIQRHKFELSEFKQIGADENRESETEVTKLEYPEG
jgi:DNA-binding NtrC family response regulator